MSGKNYGPIVSGYLDPNGRNWEDVVYQKGKAVLDKELNLSEDLGSLQIQNNFRRDLPSGWISNEFLNNASGTSALFVSSSAGSHLVLQNAITAHVNGWLCKIQHTSTINTNTLSIGTAPAGAGATRVDLVFLEVWRRLISPSPSAVGKSASGLIWQNGNVKTDPANDMSLNYTDDILDGTLAQETTKRVQIQYRLRVIQDVDLFSFPYGLDDTGSVFANSVPASAGSPDGTVTAFNYVNQSSNGDAGLWVAGDGNPANSLGTVDGYMYAIPLCALFRRNSTTYNPFTNINGAPASGGSSPRPDGLFNDIFVSDDLADLRLAVSPTGWNYQEVLDKNLTYLLDNTLRSEWKSTSPFGGGSLGHTVLFSNQIGVSTANGGAPPFSGDSTGGGPRVAQFDAVCRTFSGRPVFETMTVAVPAPGGGWANNSAVTINPSSLTIYPYSSFNFASFAPTNVQFVDVTRAVWIGTAGGKKRYGALNPSVAVANATNNAGLIEIQTAFPTSLYTGAGVVISGVGGTTEANGTWFVTVINSTHFTLQGSTFVHAFTSGGTVNYNSSVISITGLGGQPVGTLTLTCGPNLAALGLTNETLYVDVLVEYPSASGMSTTPTADFQSTAQTFLVNDPSLLPDSSPIFFDQTLLTGASVGSYFNATPSLAVLDWTHREARLTYTTSSANHITFTPQADSETANATTFTMPERVSSIVSVQRNSTPITGSVTIDTTGRIITFTNPADYTSPGDSLSVVYKALRPFPQNGEQVTVYFETRAPQTSRSAMIGTSQQVIPKYIPKTIYSLVSGVASPDAGYPFPNAYVQTGGLSAFHAGSGEYQLSGEAYISTSDFNAETGLLALPVYVPYTPNPDQVTFTRAPTDSDLEGRTYFTDTSPSNVYLPNAYGQDLSDRRPHKNFIAFIAELAADSAIGFAGQLVLVLIIRYGSNDAINGVFLNGSNLNNRTSASIFRLRNNMLNKRA